jgi:hypothetical protein
MACAKSRTAVTTTCGLPLFTVLQLIFNVTILPVANLDFPFDFLSRVNPSMFLVTR